MRSFFIVGVDSLGHWYLVVWDIHKLYVEF